MKSLSYPLAAPSANISTKISPVSKDDVVDEFGKRIKFILDGGRSKIGLESTILNLINKPQILRLGGIEKNKLNRFLKTKIKIINKKNKILVPGQGKLHYSPEIPIRLNVKKHRQNEAYLLIKKTPGKCRAFLFNFNIWTGPKFMCHHMCWKFRM